MIKHLEESAIALSFCINPHTVSCCALLLTKPAGLDALLTLLRDVGFIVENRGQSITLKAPDWKRPARLDTLGDEYSVDVLVSVLSGTREQKPRVKYARKSAPKRGTLLIDIDAKLRAGKGAGFKRWAKIQNLKRMAKTVNYLREYNLLDYDELERKTAMLARILIHYPQK